MHAPTSLHTTQHLGGAADDVDGHAGGVQRVQDAQVGEAPGAAARQHQPHRLARHPPPQPRHVLGVGIQAFRCRGRRSCGKRGSWLFQWFSLGEVGQARRQSLQALTCRPGQAALWACSTNAPELENTCHGRCQLDRAVSYLVVGQADVVVALQLRPRLQPGQRALRVRVAVVQQHQLHAPATRHSPRSSDVQRPLDHAQRLGHGMAPMHDAGLG